jgi:NAD(P)-dependent dehydrogenase (short-subunit alcohol dehydrogenase family)
VNIKDKVVLLTGASTGIGKGVAKVFLQKKAKVIVFGQHKPQYCTSFHKVDVGNEAQIISALSRINKIDILINNAGVAKDARVEDTTGEMLDEMINVNFKGVFWMSKYSIPKLRKKGCIVNISSLCGLKSFPGIGVYSATKAAVISLTQTLAQELAPRGIRVNGIAAGVVDTDMWRKRFGPDAKRVLKDIAGSTLLKRLANPDDMAHAVIFLCENDFIDGETILVDGGEFIYAG